MIFSRVLASPVSRFRSMSSSPLRKDSRLEKIPIGVAQAVGDRLDVLRMKQRR